MAEEAVRTRDKAKTRQRLLTAASELFYENAGSQDKTLKLYQDHVHDLLNDVDKEKVMHDVVAWIGARLA